MRTCSKHHNLSTTIAPTALLVLSTHHWCITDEQSLRNHYNVINVQLQYFLMKYIYKANTSKTPPSIVPVMILLVVSEISSAIDWWTLHCDFFCFWHSSLISLIHRFGAAITPSLCDTPGIPNVCHVSRMSRMLWTLLRSSSNHQDSYARRRFYLLHHCSFHH